MKYTKAFLLAMALLAVFIPGCLSPAQQKAEQGDEYLDKQDRDNALTMYSQAASLDPGLNLNSKMAQAYAGKGDDACAKKDYALAAYYYSKAKGFDAAIDIGDLYGKAFYESGKLDLSRQKYVEAVAAFSAAIDAGYDNKDVRLSRAEAYKALGCLSYAIGDAGLCLDTDANSVKALGIRGYAYFKTGEYRKALADLNAAIALDQTVKEAYFDRGMVLKSQGELRGAVNDFQRALQMDPSYLEARIWQGRTYYALTEYSAAIQQFTFAVELNPSEAVVAYNDRAVCLGKTGEFNAASADLDNLAYRHPAYYLAYYNRGALFMKMVQPQHAIDDLDTYLCLDISDKFGCRDLAYGWRGYYSQYAMCCFSPGVSQYALEKCDRVLSQSAGPEELPYSDGALYFGCEAGDSNTAVYIGPGSF
jgi:tetratricopeptide (TPR) repeat protein